MSGLEEKFICNNFTFDLHVGKFIFSLAIKPVLMIKDPKQGSKHSNVTQAELCFDIINVYVFWFSFACLFV